jgi:hypothetical protein
VNTATPNGIWSRGRLLGVAASLLVVQAAALWLFSGRPVESGWTRSGRPEVHWLQRDGKGLAWAANPLTVDPAFHALPDPRHFSGAAWLTPPGLRFDLPANREEPRWLPPPATWGDGLADYLRTNPPLAQAPLEVPRPSPTAVQPVERPAPSRSQIRVEGELTGRTVAVLPEVPPLAASGLLPDTVVEIVVHRDGTVLTARLAETRPAATPEQRADQRRAAAAALRLARQVVFAPMPDARVALPDPNGLASGRLVFQWLTHPLLPP